MPAKKKKTTARKSTSKSPVKKKSSAKKAKSAGPREHEIASSALKLVDQAAALLRQGIRTSANTTEKTRLEAKQKAHTLLNKASSSLSGLLSGSTSTLRNVLNKL
ncbi:MAG: hypothetical protein ACOYMS_06470 [Terrimicrobiaceae bacterium]